MKKLRIDQQALQFTLFLDIWLDQQPEALEVIGLQYIHQCYNKYALITQ